MTICPTSLLMMGDKMDDKGFDRYVENFDTVCQLSIKLYEKGIDVRKLLQVELEKISEPTHTNRGGPAKRAPHPKLK